MRLHKSSRSELRFIGHEHDASCAFYQRQQQQQCIEKLSSSNRRENEFEICSEIFALTQLSLAMGCDAIMDMRCGDDGMVMGENK
jgi:hypothetical protein